MIKITRESCRAANACWSDARLAAVIPAEGLTPAEVAALEDVPLADRVWALVYAAGMSAAEQRLFACRCARRALSRAANPDPRSVASVDVAERYARGEATDAELDEARRAARDAAYAVRAARAAAYAAADAAARDDERRAQLADLVAVLERA